MRPIHRPPAAAGAALIVVAAVAACVAATGLLGPAEAVADE
jgi:hypothetical protein